MHIFQCSFRRSFPPPDTQSVEDGPCDFHKIPYATRAARIASFGSEMADYETQKEKYHVLLNEWNEARDDFKVS